jgi:phage baseplate assembly protein W
MSLADDFYLVDINFNNDIKPAPNGDFQLITGINNLRQALFNRLVTVKGSLSHRPLYGVGVQLYQNDVSTLAKQRQIALEIRNQFKQDFRVNDVTGVSFEAMPDGQFTITYKVEANGLGTVTDTVNPFGEFTL